jgi:hypothetical protein
MVGVIGASDESWSWLPTNPALSCDQAARLYCIEQ